MQEKKEKIALIYDVIFPYVTGGAERRYFEVGRRLAAQGYDVHLYGMKSWEGEDVIFLEGMTLHALMAGEPLYTSAGKRSVGESLRFGLSAFKLYREPFDVVDCCGFPYFSLLPLRLITWLRRKPLYSTWHEVWGKRYWKEYLGSWGLFGYLVERIVVRLPDTIISVSDSTTKALGEKLGRSRGVVTIPNGIDLEMIRQAESRQAGSDIIFVGRLLGYKNIDKLIEATARVKEILPSIRLTIVGDGPERERLEELAANLGLEKNVDFVGFVSENKLFPYMRSSKMLALPSSREGFGMVALEAMALGLPVLTVNEPGNAARHLVAECDGGVITDLTVSSIAEGIMKLLQEPGNEIRMADVERHDWRNIVREIEYSFALRK